MVMDKLVAAPYHSQQHPLTEEGEASLHCQVLAERDTTLTKVGTDVLSYFGSSWEATYFRSSFARFSGVCKARLVHCDCVVLVVMIRRIFCRVASRHRNLIHLMSHEEQRLRA